MIAEKAQQRFRLVLPYPCVAKTKQNTATATAAAAAAAAAATPFGAHDILYRCTHIPPVAAQLLPSPFGRDIHPGGNCCQIVRGSSKLANTKKSLVLSREFRDCCCGGGGGRGCCSALCAPRNAPRKTPQKTNKQTGTGTRIKTKTRFHKR